MSSPEKLQQRRTIATTNFCSTPLAKLRRLSSISASGINTNSSSSSAPVGFDKSQIIARAIRKKHVKKRRKRGAKAKRRVEPKRKIADDSDTGWETKSEESVSSSAASKENIASVLFKDVGSPERIREATNFIFDKLESPIFQPRQKEIESPRRVSLELEEALPLRDLPSLSVRVDQSDDEENEIVLAKESVPKTYLGSRFEKRLNHVPRTENKEWLVHVSVPTTSSDALWDNFVRNNYEEVRKYLAQPSANSHSEALRRKASFNVHHTEKNNENNAHQAFKENVQQTKRSRCEQRSNPPKMDVVRKRWDRTLQKMVCVTDVYEYSDNECDEFTPRNETEGRIFKTLNQYLRYCKVEKKKSEEQFNLSDSSSTESNENCSGSPDILRSSQRAREGKRSRKHVQSETKGPEALSNESNGVLDKMNENLKHAKRRRLKRKQGGFPESFPSVTAVQNDQYEFSKPPRKKARKRNISNVENDATQQSITSNKPPTRSAPIIKSTQLLTGVRYEKLKQHWRVN